MSGYGSPRLLALSEGVYRSLSILYPRAHRREYGPLMTQAYRDLAREAWRRGGRQGLALLWARTLADLVRTAARERLDALAAGGFAAMENRPVAPLPWWQIVLAVFPGLVLVATARGEGRALKLLSDWGVPASMGSIRLFGLLLAALPAGVACIRSRRYPAWGLPALGVLVGLGAAGPFFLLLGVPGLLAAVVYMLVTWRCGDSFPGWAWAVLALAISLSFLPIATGSLNVWALMGVGATLLVALLGLPLARRYGAVAGLGVAAAGFALWEETFDLTYGLGHTFWGDAMVAALGLFLLVVAPVCVLRARAVRGQAWGLLLPAAVALAGVAAINVIVRTDPAALGLGSLPWALDSAHGISYGSLGRGYLVPLLLRDGVTVVQVLLALVLALVLYGRAGAAEAGGANRR